MSLKNDLLEKWDRNRTLVNEFKNKMESHLNETSSWDRRAFFDSDITCGQYLTALKEVSEKEYSNAQREGLISYDIHDDAYPDYIKNLDTQFDNLKKLSDSMFNK